MINNIKMTRELKDLASISGISEGKKKKLKRQGIKNPSDMLALGEVGLQKMNGIGKKGVYGYMISAQALSTKKVVRKSKNIPLPQTGTEIFLDLEGIESEKLIYLIGIFVRKGDNEEYHSFVAQDNNKQEKMLNEFIDFMKKQSDYTIYHWRPYDRTNLTKMMDKYDTSQEDRDKILPEYVLLDLHKIITDQFAFPFKCTGLKRMLKWRGFEWTHPDIDWRDAGSLYWRYVGNSDEKSLDLIRDYNRDDCEAVKIMKDWLIEQGKTV